ncbi:Tat pathway signal protein [Nostoc sp. 3335mG]|nr:Tat pathway signal protein [Nostoc sp. 3335mG]
MNAPAILHGASRRAFLQRSALLGMAGVAAPFATSLGAIGEAAAATATDYKALVCIFLLGGNDHNNTLVPYDPASHAIYTAKRSSLAISRAALEATALVPSVDLGGRAYALAPTMAPLNPLFDAGRLAVAMNVGTLIQPTTRSQFLKRTVRLPPKLFSHNDQQSFFQASSPEGAASGWGGRIGDVFQSGNGSAALTCINASGNAVFLSGRQAIQYNTGTGGPVSLLRGATSLYGSNTAAATLRQMMTETNPHMFANEYARVNKRAMDTQAQLSSLLAGVPESSMPLFAEDDSIAEQLRMVARMIAISGDLGLKRQVFFVSMGGFDLHDNLTTKQPAVLGRLASAMRAFHDTTAALGVADKVTTFTGSDFGRTLSSNGNGTDHGWGAMHFVMGGAVKGRRYYGTAPELGHNTPDDVGQGRLIPTMSVDQYASTLARWFGVPDGDLSTVLPNIGNYDRSTWSQGFL